MISSWWNIPMVTMVHVLWGNEGVTNHLLTLTFTLAVGKVLEGQKSCPSKTIRLWFEIVVHVLKKLKYRSLCLGLRVALQWQYYFILFQKRRFLFIWFQVGFFRGLQSQKVSSHFFYSVTVVEFDEQRTHLTVVCVSDYLSWNTMVSLPIQKRFQQ